LVVVRDANEFFQKKRKNAQRLLTRLTTKPIVNFGCAWPDAGKRCTGLGHVNGPWLNQGHSAGNAVGTLPL
jgi:hypothetical protein